MEADVLVGGSEAAASGLVFPAFTLFGLHSGSCLDVPLSIPGDPSACPQNLSPTTGFVRLEPGGSTGTQTDKRTSIGR